jgi:hypothetical protein
MDFLTAVQEYRCVSCGTCVLLADEEEVALDLAA